MPKQWTADEILDLARGFQPACVLAAAADLDLFDAVGTARLTADAIAARLHCNKRGITILLDALVALQMLNKQSTRYSVPASIAKLLNQDESDSVLAMAQHQANCLRRWDQLAKVIKTGKLAQRIPSIRGRQGIRLLSSGPCTPSMRESLPRWCVTFSHYVSTVCSTSAGLRGLGPLPSCMPTVRAARPSSICRR